MTRVDSHTKFGIRSSVSSAGRATSNVSSAAGSNKAFFSNLCSASCNVRQHGYRKSLTTYDNIICLLGTLVAAAASSSRARFASSNSCRVDGFNTCISESITSRLNHRTEAPKYLRFQSNSFAFGNSLEERSDILAGAMAESNAGAVLGDSLNPLGVTTSFKQKVREPALG